MSVIDKLRQARNGEEIAREVEPLAQALAKLSDELKETLEELRDTASSTHNSLEAGTVKLNTCTENATNKAKSIQDLFTNILTEQRKAAQRFTLTMWGLAILTSLMGGAGAGIGLWLWWKPSAQMEKHAQHWKEVAATYNSLDPERKQQFRKLMDWPEPQQQEARPRTGRHKQ